MAVLTIEGTYRDGRIELEEVPTDVNEARVMVVFLPPAARSQAEEQGPGTEESRREAGRRLLARMKRGYHLGGERPYGRREELYEHLERAGLDLGIEAFGTLDTGERIPNPRPLKRAQRKLKLAQRRLSRRVKGSHRRRKARILLAKAHLDVQRARLDHAHKVAHDLASRFDTIYVEKLNIRGMVRNHPLAQAISDAGWGLFLAVLGNKAASAGRRVVEVNPAGTSQTCSGCGARVPKTLFVRWHSCPYCELSLHRDHNAALRVRQVGGGTAVGR